MPFHLIRSITSTAFGRAVVETARPFYHRLQPWTGLNGLDRRLLEYLPDGSGFFIEAGANDGLRQSNTYYLERRRGWRGLLIEPIPHLAARCRRNRPGAIVVNAALVAPDDHDKPVVMDDVDLMSIVRGARGTAYMDEQHLPEAEAVQGITRQPLSVLGRTLSNVIDEANLPHIDLLSLDVEGYELNVLKGLDLSRHAPKWVLVETANSSGVAEILGPRYATEALLSHHDWLFRSRAAE